MYDFDQTTDILSWLYDVFFVIVVYMSPPSGGGAHPLKSSENFRRKWCILVHVPIRYPYLSLEKFSQFFSVLEENTQHWGEIPLLSSQYATLPARTTSDRHALHVKFRRPIIAPPLESDGQKVD